MLAAFGVRIIGFGFLKDLFGKRHLDYIVIFLMIFVISGFLLSEIIFLGPVIPPPFKTNDAMWFAFEALLAAWLLFAFFLKRTIPGRKKLLWIILLVILLSFPGTVQFLLHRSARVYYKVSPNAIEVARYLETTPPGSVIFHLLHDGPSLASNLAGRASVISEFEACIVQNIGIQETSNRLNDVAVFFNSDDKSTDRRAILNKYKVSYVYAPSVYAERLDKELSLLQIFRNSEYIVYKVKKDIHLQGH
jgi:uncharacterized membrane protein